MLSRAERNTKFAITTTDEAVGPGSYAVPEPYQPLKGPSAAFAVRSTPQHTSTDDNSADCYTSSAATASLTRPWTTPNSSSSNISSSSFASSTQRFAADTEAVAKPGPGAYQTSPKWLRQQPHYWHTSGSSSSSGGGGAASPKHRPSTALLGGCAIRMPASSVAAASPAPPSAAAGQHQHAHNSNSTHELLLSTPPSIPARHQSFGYETGADGRLVMQPPPPPLAPAPAAAGQTGAAGKAGQQPGSATHRPKSVLRPGSLQHSSSSRKQIPASAAGGALRQPSRQLQQQLQVAQQPAVALNGVGGSSPRFRSAAGGKLVLSKAYNSSGADRGVGSAAFASTSARLHQQEPDPDKATPGPGTYTAAAAQRPTSAPLHHTHAAVGSSHRSPHRSLKITAGGGIVVGGISTAAAGGVFPSPRHKQPLFARSAGRSAALSAGPGWSLPPSKSVAPGPGTYNLRQPPAASTLTSLGAAAAASGVGGGCGGGSVCGGVSPPRSHRLLQGGSGFVDQQAAAAAGDDQQASAAAAVGGFGCSSHRFGDNSTVSPGPGKYSSDQLLSMSADVARRAAAAGKRGAFGTAAAGSRGTTGNGGSGALDACLGFGGSGGSSSSVPGPGCYNVRSSLADKLAASAERPSAGFVSASERFTPSRAPIACPDHSASVSDGSTTVMRGDQSRLGPGAYIKLDDWRRGGPSDSGGTGRSSWHSAYKNAPFGSESGRRFGAAGASDGGDTAPGPGAYSSVDVAKVFQPLSMPGSGAGFTTSAQRFKLAAATPASVGPGSYYMPAQSSLIKPSFNVTLDQ